MSPLTTCSPHSSTFSQRPQSLLPCLLLFFFIFLNSSSTKISFPCPPFCDSSQLAHTFSIIFSSSFHTFWWFLVSTYCDTTVLYYFYLKGAVCSEMLIWMDSLSFGPWHPLLLTPTPPPSFSFLFAFRSCRLEDSIHLPPDTAQTSCYCTPTHTHTHLALLGYCQDGFGNRTESSPLNKSWKSPFGAGSWCCCCVQTSFTHSVQSRSCWSGLIKKKKRRLACVLIVVGG